MYVIERETAASPVDEHWRDHPFEPGVEMVDDRSFEEWKEIVLAQSPDRCPECDGPLTSGDDTDDDNWSDFDAAGYWCEGEIIRRYCLAAYVLAWPDLRRGHPSTLGEMLYERVVYRHAVPQLVGVRAARAGRTRPPR
jgi:hypothetical protein